MKTKSMFRLLIVSLCSLAVILIAKEFGGKTSPKVPILTDYPNSTWYSEQTGDMIEVGEDFEYEDEIPRITITKEYRGARIPFFLFHNASEYWFLFDENVMETELEGIRFTGEITEQDQYTYMTFYGFTPMGKDSVEGRKQITELFGSQGKVVFKKVPNQHFDQYPNSIWKSEEMEYTLVVPNKEDLEDDGKAELWVEQEGDKERFEFFEPLYDAHAYGEICYNPKQEQEDIVDSNDYIYCSILILEEDGHLYMTLSDFDLEKDCPEKIKKYFSKNFKLTLKRVTDSEAATEEPELRTFLFQSADEVESISDEDLLYIAQNKYEAADFISDIDSGIYDLFDIPLMEKEVDGILYSERVETYVLQSKLPLNEVDVNEEISTEVFQELIDAHCSDLIEAANTWDGNTGSRTGDEKIIYCGENDYYVEYSIQYTELRTYYRDEELVTLEIPRAYRRCFMKNRLYVQNENHMGPVYFGKLSLEKIKDIEDFHISVNSGPIIYRNFQETDTAYVYTDYFIHTAVNEDGVPDMAILEKADSYYDKTTHEITGEVTVIKRIEIPKTEN